ncbi:hypothetical protein TCAL_04742 [Tigriopus californicus]|uniref:Coatomer subunit delta n=1 Tax=Tigriopus californicus TaxID=6832 RepID=A0A553P3X0_TIGCA|nr:coatomer subunit delta-like [Tigriopus californicus]TRY72377.1 hypothetical protein TCAL_04742 [Tigriopus californicus]
MVLLAAAVCTRGGKALLSRQFVEMTKSRIEGLLAAFPKLISSSSGSTSASSGRGSGGPGSSSTKQHTFVETESVRYVYQPMEKIYMLLITTKTSNILEDLETLRLFARVLPEYCRNMDEADILDNAFNLIFAFDEIVALGYRESVNLAQIRTFVEMDSHEEKVYQAVRQTQEREAKQKMREKAKELHRQKMEIAKRGGRGGPPMSSYGGQGGFTPGPNIGDTLSTPAEPPKPTYSAPAKKTTNSKAMKLGGKAKDVDSFVDQLMSEGVNVMTEISAKQQPAASKAPVLPEIPTESVHAKLEEKITVTANRDGGLESMELSGIMTLRITDDQFGRIKLQLQNPTNKGIQMQTHPNIDKELLKTRAQIGLKNSGKPFPLSTDVGVLKWRYTTTEESNIPLSINCWPSDNGQGGCDVNIEYELEQEQLELNDVVISIPIPHGVNAPVVAECDGAYTYEKRGALLWQLPVIDSSNKTGSMEFSCGGNADDFFPIHVSFYSKKTYSEIKVLDCLDVDSEAPVKYSSETLFIPDKYDIV